MPSRRVLLAVPLAVAVVAGLVGCSSRSSPTVDPQLQADHSALSTALAVERALLPLVDEGRGGRLPDGAQAAVAAHVDALSSAVGSPSPSDTPSVTASSTPGTPGGQQLVVSATAAARSHLAAVPGVTGPVARLLASVAASDLALAAASGSDRRVGEEPGPLPDTGTRTLSDAWLAALTAEQQARYAYQVAAARLLAAGSDEAGAAEAGVVVHQGRADRATAALTQLGVDPPAPEAGYALPGPVPDAAATAALLADVEEAAAAAAANLVAASDAALRRLPVGWLVASARAEARWSGRVPALPGLATTAA